MPVLCLAFEAWRRGEGWLGRLVTLGLAVSAVADVVIEASFLGGLALFLCAHLVYIAAFVADDRRWCLLRALPFELYAIAMYRFLAPGLGALAVPVGAYALVIATMMWRAAARVRPGERAGWLALAGALVFGLSDTLLALHRFHAPLALPGAVILTYWAGQLGIALSAMRRR